MDQALLFITGQAKYIVCVVCRKWIFRHVRKIAKDDCWLRNVCLSARRSARSTSAPTGRIFINCDISAFFENLSINFKFHYSPTRTTGTLREDQYTFLIISRSFLLITRKVSDKSGGENQNIHFMLN
jgi:hypothetical protein